jgi:S1-C subfamily serine protease
VARTRAGGRRDTGTSRNPLGGGCRLQNPGEVGGSLVTGTICGSPADRAGLTGGAVITAVNGQAAGSPDHLGGILARFHPGHTISVT